MGELADEIVDRMLEDYFPFTRPRNNTWRFMCKRCGMAKLKWRETEDGWRLFEKKKVEHNRWKMHVCNPVSEDDFDTVD